jgi:hypothetical protein
VAKRRAARANGRKSKNGGRPRIYTMTESIMRRKLSASEHHLLREAFLRLTLKEQNTFKKYFRLDERNPDMASINVPHRNPNPRMKHILRKFRLMARFLLMGGW